MINAFLAVGLGATLGAWSRWGLTSLLNTGLVPMGTLLANLLGGLLMGVALAYFTQAPSQNEWRLFIMTGFLGGLTTFSAFSAEAFTLLNQQHYYLAGMHMVSHVVGSLIMTAIGFAAWQYFR